MIPCLVNFAAAVERQDGDKFTVVCNWPYALRNKFGQPGTYKFMIAVHGPGGTKEKLAQIEWHGKRNTMRACDVIACPPNGMA
jgi:hypothetical protein